MLRITAAAALALGLSIASAQAAEHEVAIVAEGFFPEITYVQPGDTVTFVNTYNMPRQVYGDAFTFHSSTMDETESFSISIVAGMPNEYYGRSGNSDLDTDGDPAAQADTDGDGSPMRGVLSFAPPPLQN